MNGIWIRPLEIEMILSDIALFMLQQIYLIDSLWILQENTNKKIYKMLSNIQEQPSKL